MNKIFVVLVLFIGSLNPAFSNELISREKIILSETKLWAKLSEEGKLKPKFSYLEKIEIFKISYQSDAEEIFGFSLEPKGDDKYPCILFNRGGTAHNTNTSLGLALFGMGKLAAKGYVILVGDYRKKDEFGGEDLNDVLALNEIRKDFAKVDTSNTGMIGWSRGGIMTYLAVKELSNIKAVAIGNSPVDLFASCKFRPEMEEKIYSRLIPNYSVDKKEQLKQRSALFWVKELNKTTSFLLLCGTEDKKVNPEQSKKMAKALSKKGYDVKLACYATDHAFSNSQDSLLLELEHWFGEKLKN